MRLEGNSGDTPHFLRSTSFDPTFDSYLPTSDCFTKEIHTLDSTVPRSDLRDVSDETYYPYIGASGDGNFANGQLEVHSSPLAIEPSRLSALPRDCCIHGSNA
jgi:hypothetical protein